MLESCDRGFIMSNKQNKFTQLNAIAAPLMEINIDTDTIIPSREMKGVSKDGLSPGLFANWRYTDVDQRIENPDFVLNISPFRKAKIILGGDNFGCGSSREHAVWALKEWGVECIVASSFGAIFYSNCVRNGVLPIIADVDIVSDAAAIASAGNTKDIFIVDLPNQTFCFPSGDAYGFEIGTTDKEMLVEGLDPIGLTLKRDKAILAFQDTDKTKRPWVYI